MLAAGTALPDKVHEALVHGIGERIEVRTSCTLHRVIWVLDAVNLLALVHGVRLAEVHRALHLTALTVRRRMVVSDLSRYFLLYFRVLLEWR